MPVQRVRGDALHRLVVVVDVPDLDDLAARVGDGQPLAEGVDTLLLPRKARCLTEARTAPSRPCRRWESR